MTKQDKVFMVMGGVLLSTGAMLSAYGFHGLADSLTEADRQLLHKVDQLAAQGRVVPGTRTVLMRDLSALVKRAKVYAPDTSWL
ncbi:MAG: hypothetical protein QGH93_05975, partial [Gammaproteobacteria bacterium]|nr:hypothetical protein [Gammaproteobacteria bacterium]